MSSQSANARDLTAFEQLEKTGIRFVRFTWVDLINFTRYRVIPLAHFKALLASDRPGITITKAGLGLVFLTLAPGFGTSGEYLYAPDLTSARALGFAAGHVSVMGYFEDKEKPPARPLEERDALRVPLCSRDLLRRTVAAAKQTHGIDFLMGFETEVIFLKSTSPIQAVNDYGWSVSPAISAGTPEAAALEEIADALAASGIELQMYHAEAAPGQFEIVTGPLPPLEAVDALVVTRETIHNIASAHGLRATLAPRVYDNSCGSAAHVHISLRGAAPAVPAQERAAAGLSTLEASFLQGLLDHLQGAAAFTLPTAASYARVVDGAWSGGTWVAWGRDNREAPVRLCGARGRHNFEVKCLDGTANAYAAAAALLAGGMLGVRAGAALRAGDCGCLAAQLSAEERAALGVTRRMPLRIEEARAYLKEDKELVAELGEEFVKTFLTVNETLQKTLEAPTPEEAMTLLVKTY